MLSEGRREEFPGLFASARRSRLWIGVSSPAWAALAGIGASFLVGAIARELISPFFSSPEALRWPGPRPFEIATIVGTATGIAVSLAAGGRRGAIFYVAYVAASAVLSLVRAVLGLLQCGPSSLPCEFFDPLRATLSHWTGMTGLLLGIPLTAALRSGARGANALLEAAGAFGFVGWAVVSAFGLVVTPASLASIGPTIRDALLLFSTFLQAVSAGYVLALRARRPVRSGSLLLALVAIGWGSFGVSQIRQALAAGSGVIALAFLAAPVIAAALVIPATLVWRRTLAAMR